MSKSMRPTKTGKSKTVITSWWANQKYVAAILFGLAFLLYANSLTNGFVLDDSLVITKNQFTTKGISGIPDIFTHDTFKGYYGDNADQLKIVGGRYRPLSVGIFAILYQLFGEKPFVFHFWNVLLYATCCALLYLVLRRIFDQVWSGSKSAMLSGAAVLLYTVHPIHTEVVNNIKSNDEILSLLFSLGALFMAMRFIVTGKALHAWLSGAALFVGALAKENSIVFLAIIPLTLFFMRDKASAKKPSLSILWISLALSFGLYFILRLSVIGWSLGEAPLDLINNPFIKVIGDQWVHCTTSEKLAMAFWSLAKYIQLLFFPLTLSTDYYPRYVSVITFANPVALISLLVHVGLAAKFVHSIFKKEKSVIWYSIGFYLIALSIVSNLVFPIGTNLAERFLFVPSIGFCLVFGALFVKGYQFKPPWQTVSLVALVLVTFLLAARTVIRNPDFKSNIILFAKDIQASPKSAKIQNAYGALVAQEALAASEPAQRESLAMKALPHLTNAIDIHPAYLEAFYMRGNVHFILGAFDSAIADYRTCIQINPNFNAVYSNYALALREYARYLLDTGGDKSNAIKMLEESMKLFPNEPETDRLLQLARQ